MPHGNLHIFHEFFMIFMMDLMGMGMGQNPGTFCSPQVIAGIYGRE